MATRNPGEQEPVIVKKYANRRLYNTATSSYVTLEDLAGLVKEGTDFVVYDAKSGNDITRSVLTQIIFEQESKGENLLPINFLRQLISFYDNNLQALVPSYLEYSLETLSREQENFSKQMADAIGGGPLRAMEDQVKQNMAMFEKAMEVFLPGARNADRETARSEGGEETGPREADEIAALKAQLETMQRQLDTLSERSAGGEEDKD